MANSPPYFGSIPTIQQAYQNDPRTKLAQSALALGTSTVPVAQGGWAVTDGLARVAQAIAGAVINKNQEKKYGQREQAYVQGLQDASKLASTPQPSNPAVANPANNNPMTAAAQALSGPSPAPIQTVDPTAALGMPQNAPPGGSTGAGAPPVAQQTGSPSGGPPSPALGMAGAPPMSGAMVLGGGLSPSEYYVRGIRPIEGGTDPQTGAFRTSPKGAVGPGQLLPDTAKEAAKLAGLPWDETRFRTDPQYNDALGVAYYTKQLQDFGDPVIAAAAYNAGPARTRRALRRAKGGDFTQFLPAETQQYVQNFTQAIGTGGASQSGGYIPLQVQPPQMENVPDAPAAPDAPSQAATAPALPTEVQSNRIAIAQQMLASGNPDLIGIAQTYLNQGLTEQNDARRLASQQQFQQEQAGYNADLSDVQNARDEARRNAYGERSDAIQRNFSREQTYGNQQFQAGQSALDRNFRSTEAGREREFQREERLGTEAFTSAENERNRTNRLDVANARQQMRNAYFNSPTGRKLQQQTQENINKNENAIAQYERFMDLNKKQVTGGLGQNLPVVGGSLNFFDRDLKEMDTIAKNTTLAALGGGLGAQISDSDRQFIQSANIGTQNLPIVNRNIALARIGALRRSNDYYMEFQNAQADGTQAQFARDWSLFAKSVPVVQYDKNGNAIPTDRPMTFAEWKASRPKYDASGKRIN